jgi:hypothetical protein
VARGKKPQIATVREAEARRKIEHKLKVLARWRKRGVPQGLEAAELPPTSLTKFAAWTVAGAYYGLGPVEPVSKSTVIAKNPDLKALAQAELDAWAAKQRQRSSKPSRETELHRLRTDWRELKDQRTLLLSQWTSERHERLQAERREADLRTTNLHLIRERDTLLEEVRALTVRLEEALTDLATCK